MWQHVTKVLETLRRAQLKVKLEKCVFGVTSIEFLGHVVSHGLITMEPGKKQGNCEMGGAIGLCKTSAAIHGNSILLSQLRAKSRHTS